MNELQLAKSSEFFQKSNEHSLVLRKNSNSDTFNFKAKSCSVLPGNLINFDSLSNEKSQNYTLSCTEAIDSTKWLQKYGLQAIKLNFEYILSMIGFKQNQGLSRFKVYFYNDKR